MGVPPPYLSVIQVLPAVLPRPGAQYQGQVPALSRHLVAQYLLKGARYRPLMAVLPCKMAALGLRARQDQETMAHHLLVDSLPVKGLLLKLDMGHLLWAVLLALLGHTVLPVLHSVLVAQDR